MHFTYIYTVYIIAHMVGMITEAFRKNESIDCMLHGSQKHSAHKSTKV
jgi:hypothetical protein